MQADLKAFAFCGVFGTSVITALTAQNTTGVFGIQSVPPDFVEAQARAVLDDFDVAAIKIGMLGDVPTIECVARILERAPGIPVVLDPVMVAASGDPLLVEDAISALRERLLPLATIVTPNAHEAGLLAAAAAPRTQQELVERAQELAVSCGTAIFLKGGRLAAGRTVRDVLAQPGAEPVLFEDERIAVARPHGSGCATSAALAAGLALGLALPEAVSTARRYVRAALERAARSPLGSGSTPLLHGPL